MLTGRRKATSIKILIVDDEELILEEASEVLTDEGYECFIASDVDAAVETVNTTPGIALILTDLKMPRKSGADLINIIETTYEQDIKFIVMSGHGSRIVEKNGIDLTLYPFLNKPLDIDQMIEKVASVIKTTEYQL
jgi:DNA-binding NtrC family response regulator